MKCDRLDLPVRIGGKDEAVVRCESAADTGSRVHGPEVLTAVQLSTEGVSRQLDCERHGLLLRMAWETEGDSAGGSTAPWTFEGIVKKL